MLAVFHSVSTTDVGMSLLVFAPQTSGVNPAGDAGDTSLAKIGLRGTVMHYVPPPKFGF